MQPSGSKQQIVWHASNRSKNQWFIFRLHPNNAQPYSQVKKCMKINGRETTYVPECWKIQEHEYLLWHLQQNCGSWSHPTHRDMARCIFMPPSPPPGAAYQKCRKNIGIRDFLISGSFFAFPKWFWGSGGVYKWSWAIWLHPVLIWAHLEPYGPISNQSPWCSSKNIWTEVLDQDLGLPDQVLDPLDLVQYQVPELDAVPDLDLVLELIFGTPWTWSSNGTESTHINWYNSTLVCMSVPMCTFNSTKT